MFVTRARYPDADVIGTPVPPQLGRPITVGMGSAPGSREVRVSPRRNMSSDLALMHVAGLHPVRREGSNACSHTRPSLEATRLALRP